MAGDTVLYTFEWDSDASSVVVTGTFDNWSLSKPLTKNGQNNKFSAAVELPKDQKVLFKYVVDGDWLTASNHKIEKDLTGYENNVIYPEDLSEYASAEKTSESNVEGVNIQRTEAPVETVLNNNSNETLNANVAAATPVLAPKHEETEVNFESAEQSGLEGPDKLASVEENKLKHRLPDNSSTQEHELFMQKENENTSSANIETLRNPEVKSVISPEKEKPEEVAKLFSTDNGENANTWNVRKNKVLRSIDLNGKKERTKSPTRSNSEISLVSVSSPKKKDLNQPLVTQKSNTESSAFTNIDTPSQPDIKEAENGLSQVVGEKEGDAAIVLNSLHLDDLESSASFKSISSNEIFSSTHGTLSNFNMHDSKENVDKANIASSSKANSTTNKSKNKSIDGSYSNTPLPETKLEHKSLLSFSLVSRFKKIFK